VGHLGAGVSQRSLCRALACGRCIAALPQRSFSLVVDFTRATLLCSSSCGCRTLATRATVVVLLVINTRATFVVLLAC
jgi:hypothetical protein